MNPKYIKEILLNLANACEKRRQNVETQRSKTFPTEAKYDRYITREDTLRDFRDVFHDAAMKFSDPQ